MKVNGAVPGRQTHLTDSDVNLVIAALAGLADEVAESLMDLESMGHSELSARVQWLKARLVQLHEVIAKVGNAAEDGVLP